MTLNDSKPDFKVMVLLLVFMQLTRDLFAIAKFLLNIGLLDGVLFNWLLNYFTDHDVDRL